MDVLALLATLISGTYIMLYLGIGPFKIGARHQWHINLKQGYRKTALILVVIAWPVAIAGIGWILGLFTL